MLYKHINVGQFQKYPILKYIHQKRNILEYKDLFILLMNIILIDYLLMRFAYGFSCNL